ncbi:MAG TPA: hypothetical protein PLE99_06225 [Candidatus Thiothrix moscowensis]|uniref:hypothetical protein n=1 Tax=unclassified Thiothrix TaxID=2636184 RepID=UPI001A31D6D2|nr:MULTISPECIES: hypothetical protein [unclassified Thiothrix]MBJ6611110.1 hypothetical protein [Candidatus Thiothrix moscowensis]HRJ52342.1 hypothetical protein [Candidatus Thiothrix moscowensis]HRJ92657.1 hypothetical protein [Candidatus Thiothrix moscowensis]
MHIMRSSRVVISSGLATILFCATGAIAPATAADTNLKSRVTLVATISNRAALLPGRWLIYQYTDRERRHPVETLPGHSGTVYLPAGRYLARVELNDKIRETSFKIETDTEKTITLPMD